MTTIVVSPHLDDAALSASVEIGKGEATVLTVFTAAPAADRPVSPWDLLTGARNSRDRQLARHAEDAAAMALLSARSVHLDEFEALYRDGAADLAAATERMAGHFAGAEEIWLPAAIGGHPDHRLARDAALNAARRAGHREVVFYADFPYVAKYGWPAKAVGRPADPHLDADAYLEYELRSAGLDPAGLDLTVTELDDAQRSRKAAVVGAYPSQASALGLGPGELAALPAKLDFELHWRTAVPAEH